MTHKSFESNVMRYLKSGDKITKTSFQCSLDNYTPITVGINNDRYAALVNVFRSLFICEDMIPIICEHWLRIETLEIRASLTK